MIYQIINVEYDDFCDYYKNDIGFIKSKCKIYQTNKIYVKKNMLNKLFISYLLHKKRLSDVIEYIIKYPEQYDKYIIDKLSEINNFKYSKKCQKWSFDTIIYDRDSDGDDEGERKLKEKLQTYAPHNTYTIKNNNYIFYVNTELYTQYNYKFHNLKFYGSIKNFLSILERNICGDNNVCINLSKIVKKIDALDKDKDGYSIIFHDSTIFPLEYKSIKNIKIKEQYSFLYPIAYALSGYKKNIFKCINLAHYDDVDYSYDIDIDRVYKYIEITYEPFVKKINKFTDIHFKYNS